MRYPLRNSLLAGWLAACFSPVTPAQTDEVVVTATRTALSRADLNAATIVIDRDAIANAQAQDIGELLRFNAGLDLSRNGGPGQFTSLFIRGAESDHTVVLIDGVKINPGTVGVAALANISLNDVERIEIVKGPRSTLYGSEAIGGVVQVFTRRGGTGTRWDARLGGGSNATVDASAGVFSDSDVWRGGIDVARLQTDGFPARVEATQDSAHDNTTVNAYLGRSFAGWQAEVRHWQATGNTEYFDFDLTPLDQDFTNTVSALAVSGAPTSWWHTKLILSHMRDDIEQNQSDDFARTDRDVLDWQNDFRLRSSQLVSGGLNWSREDAVSQVFGTGFDTTTDVAEAYLQYQWSDAVHRVVAAVRHTDHDTFGGHTTGELSYGVWIGPALRLRAGAASGFRAPDSTDRFGFGGNPALTPETSRNLEFGLTWTPTERQRWELSAFHNEIDNLIVFVDPDGFLGPVPGRNENIGKARIVGVELGQQWNHGPWSIQWQAIAQNPQNRDDNRQLARRAKYTFTGSAAYDGHGYRFAIDMLATDRRPDSDFSDVVNPGYALFNLTAHKRLGNNWTARGRIENLFDKDYVLADGFNTQDRAFFVQLAYGSD